MLYPSQTNPPRKQLLPIGSVSRRCHIQGCPRIKHTFRVLFITLLLSPSTGHASGFGTIAEYPFSSLAIQVCRAAVCTIVPVLSMLIIVFGGHIGVTRRHRIVASIMLAQGISHLLFRIVWSGWLTWSNRRINRMVIFIPHMLMSLRSRIDIRRAFSHLRLPVVRVRRRWRIRFRGRRICLARAVGWPLSWGAIVHTMHALTARAWGRSMHTVHGLVIIIGTTLGLPIKGSFSLLHLGAHDTIRMRVTWGPRVR